LAQVGWNQVLRGPCADFVADFVVAALRVSAVQL